MEQVEPTQDETIQSKSSKFEIPFNAISFPIGLKYSWRIVV